MSGSSRRLAVVTGASSGIGYELAKLRAENGFDLVIAADQAEIEQAAGDLRRMGAQVSAVQTDLSRVAGVDPLVGAGRAQKPPVYALLAHAGPGMGGALLD